MRHLVLIIGMTLFTGQALAQSQTPDQLRYRLDVIDAELQSLRAQIGGSSAGTSGGTLGGSDYEGEIARLTNAIEQLRYQVEQMKAATEQQLADLIFRVTELEGGDISTVETPDLGGGAASSSTTGATAQVAVTERRDLENAAADVRAGRYDQAEERLRQFLRDYPNSPLAGEAQYWLGESLFVRGIFQEAARAYLAGYQGDRAGSYAPQNLLRLGTTLGRIGQKVDACLTLQEVGRQFPAAGSDILDDAASEASRLGCG